MPNDDPRPAPPPGDHVSAAAQADNVGFHGEAEALQAIAARGPRGALAVAGLAVGVLLALWIAFFFFVFAPRGSLG